MHLAMIVTLLFVGSPLHAQAIATATGPGSYVTVGGGASAFQADYGRHQLTGAFVYADVNPQWRVGLEGEARFLHWHTEEGVTEASYLAGVRVAVWPRPARFNPYAKFLAGAEEIRFPFGYAHGGYLMYAPGAGLDIAVNDRVSLRAVDFEYGHCPQFTYGPLNPYGVSAGISVRLNGIARYPKGARAQH